MTDLKVPCHYKLKVFFIPLFTVGMKKTIHYFPGKSVVFSTWQEGENNAVMMFHLKVTDYANIILRNSNDPKNRALNWTFNILCPVLQAKVCVCLSCWHAHFSQQRARRQLDLTHARHPKLHLKQAKRQKQGKCIW